MTSVGCCSPCRRVVAESGLSYFLYSVFSKERVPKSNTGFSS